MRIVFFGTPQFAVPTLEKLLECSEFEVMAVVTQPDKPRGRGNQLIPSPVKKLALEHQLPVWQPKRIKKDVETLSNLQQTQADFFVVVAYGQIFSREMLEMPKVACVNVHGSILPKYRGAAPIQWSIFRGETQTGVTTMLMDEGMDTGAMLLKTYAPIGLLDNAHDLAMTLAKDGAGLLVETLLRFREIEPTPQNSAEATYSPLIQKSDYEIDWHKPALQIHNQVRAFYPDCVTTFRAQSLKVMATVPLGDTYWGQLPSDWQKIKQQWGEFSTLNGAPGEVVKKLKGFGAVIQTGEGFLLLQQVQLPGKRPHSGWDFVNGSRLEVGEKMG